MDPTCGGSFEDLARSLSSQHATPDKLQSVEQMATSIAAKLQASAANSQEAGENTEDWLHHNCSWKDAAEIIARNLEKKVTIVHHGGSDRQVVEAAFQEVREVDCVVPEFLNTLSVSLPAICTALTVRFGPLPSSSSLAIRRT